MATSINDISAQIQEAIEEAYKHGYEDGKAEVSKNVKTVLEAAHISMGASPAKITVTRKAHPPVSDRAPKGLVGDLIDQVLTDSPGLIGVDIQNKVVAIDGRIASKSVGNTLRRFKDKKYRKDRKKWFLIGDAEKETAEAATNEHSAVSDHANQGGPLWNHPR